MKLPCRHCVEPDGGTAVAGTGAEAAACIRFIRYRTYSFILHIQGAPLTKFLLALYPQFTSTFLLMNLLDKPNGRRSVQSCHSPSWFSSINSSWEQRHSGKFYLGVATAVAAWGNTGKTGKPDTGALLLLLCGTAPCLWVAVWQEKLLLLCTNLPLHEAGG